jgi:hypothetical protein
MRRPGFDAGRSKSSQPMLEYVQSSYASIAICKTRRDTPVATAAKNHCATRVIKFVLFMCAYPVD